MTFSSLSLQVATHQASRQFPSRACLPMRQDYLWQIESGVVRTVTHLEDGTVVPLGIWGCGDVIGKALSKFMPFQMECLTSVKVIALPANDWQQLAETLQLHLQQAGELAIIQSYKKIDTMLLNLLAWLAKKFGREVETGQLIDLRLTHQDLAELLGTTRVTVTRILSQLEQQGYIQRLRLHRIVLQEEELWHYEI